MHEGYGIWFVCQSEAVITLALLPDTEYSHLVLTERQKCVNTHVTCHNIMVIASLLNKCQILQPAIVFSPTVSNT